MGKYDKQLKTFWKIWWVGLVILVVVVLYQNYLNVQEKEKKNIEGSSKQSAVIEFMLKHKPIAY